ncbi:23S rRNA (guanosine(2251)-2'-O)-methyltransferase RlmB [Candidatus Dojkabacteria bacterium]|uniref:23S rRNA (Guanosine(2251)-2'-O)-methyltransferase RlmB n=1 Tax=Candidatus Dojkabacteria bacterium TaxID=2099670 RepID=A0A955L144_9BACT|nr:23S rRNA (guanosine(2251)-2'-O)-methyltransferase RlmB [Candidatus Dojkabacteria bacterium]
MIFYGRNIVLEALKSNHDVTKVIIQEGSEGNEKIDSIIKLAKSSNISISYQDRKEISRATNSEEHQGVYCDVKFKEANLKELINPEQEQSFVYISTATFEHNIGAISRSAEVAGLTGVIIPKNADITPTVAKTSTGAIFHIPIVKLSIFNAIKLLKDNGFFVAGIERDGNKYYENDLTSNTLFIIGGEDKSLSDPVRDKCDMILEIPQHGKVNSLNMSVASSIVFFERNRQLGI